MFERDVRGPRYDVEVFETDKTDEDRPTTGAWVVTTLIISLIIWYVIGSYISQWL